MVRIPGGPPLLRAEATPVCRRRLLLLLLRRRRRRTSERVYAGRIRRGADGALEIQWRGASRHSGALHRGCRHQEDATAAAHCGERRQPPRAETRGASRSAEASLRASVRAGEQGDFRGCSDAAYAGRLGQDRSACCPTNRHFLMERSPVRICLCEVVASTEKVASFNFFNQFFIQLRERLQESCQLSASAYLMTRCIECHLHPLFQPVSHFDMDQGFLAVGGQLLPLILQFPLGFCYYFT